MTTVHTIGHGTRTTEELVAILNSAEIRVLVDVRRFPGSRRHPHLSREALERALPELGIAYEPWGEALGGRRSKKEGGPTRHPAWRVAAFQGYADHMDTDDFRRALAQLEDRARSGEIAIMCAETLWWRCHRRLIADALVIHGFDVVHLIDASHRQTHSLHPAARLDAQNRIVYDVGHTGRMI